MANVKYTDEGQRLRLERLASLRETRKDVADLAGLKNSPEWGKLVQLLRRWAEFAKREEKHATAEFLSEIISSELFGQRVIRAQQKVADFDFVADLLDKREEQLKLLEEEIRKMEQAYAEAKEVLS